MTKENELKLACEMCAFHAARADYYRTHTDNEELFQFHWQQLDEWDAKRQTLRS